MGQSEMEIGKKNNELKLVLSQIETEGFMEAEKVTAEASKQIAEMKAQAKVTIAENKSKAIKALAEAEKKVAKSLVALRAYETAQKKIDAIESLSKNPNIVVSGESGDNIMQMMMIREAAKALGLKSSK